MGFYDLDKKERLQLVNKINRNILIDIEKKQNINLINYCSDNDTYIRKTAYLAIGKIYKSHPILQSKILVMLNELYQSDNEKVRQTSINAAGEIGIIEFDKVAHFFDTGLFDEHHSVRNAVIGSVKKNGRKKSWTGFEMGKKIFAPFRQRSSQGNMSRY
jgi:hypothetical protein